METDDDFMADLKVRLGQFLVKEKAKRKINLSRLAKETNVPKTCLHNWESGIAPRLSEKNLQYLTRLSKFFNVSVHKMLFGTNEKESQLETLHEHVFEEGKTKLRLRIEKIKE